MTTPIAEYSATEAVLADLRSRLANVVYDVSTAKGMEQAKKDRAEVRNYRTSLEKKRVEIKAPALERCRQIDSEAKRITDELLKLEGPPDAAIKAEEERKESERAAKVKAEQDRVTGILGRINEIRGALAVCARYQAPAADIAEHIADLEKIPVDDSFAEFRQQADDAKTATLAKLYDMHTNALAREAEAAEQERNRVEREARINAEAAALAQERARLAEEERQAKARREAEEAAARAARAEEDRKALEAMAEEKKRQDDALAEQRKAHLAEMERVATERAELERQKQEQAKADAERQKQARRAAQQKPSDDEMLEVLCDYYDQDRERVVDWIRQMDLEIAA